MVHAQKVRATDGSYWIKVWYQKWVHEVAQSIGTVTGARYSSQQAIWAIPYANKAEFEDKVGDHLILWVDGDGDVSNGGIDEDAIPSHPIVPGYSVEYDKDRNIIGATGFKNKPWGEFQVKGFNALVEHPFLILADDAGLGKTFQVSTAIEAKKKLGQLKHGIVLAKASLLYNWRDEIHMHTNEKAIVVAGSNTNRMKIYDQLKYSDDWTFIIMSYETFRGDEPALQLVDNHRPLEFCVMDEAHKIKNPTSKIGSVIHNLPFRYRYILTATPLINNPLEGYNYLKFGKKVDMNWFEFQNEFAIMGGIGNREIKAYKNMRTLKTLIQSNMLRRRKKDKLKELPDVAFKTITVQMSDVQKKVYKAVRDSVLEDLKETSLDKVPQALAKLMRLQQVCNSTQLVGMEHTKSSAKLDTVDDILDEIIGENNQKVIIFSRFREMADLMKERYQKYNPAFVTGEVDASGRSKEYVTRLLKRDYGERWDAFSAQKKEQLIEKEMSSDRQKEVYKFQNDANCKLFIGSSGACREGLTLTKATQVIFIDCEWSPAYVEQAWSRAHRIGQKNAVTVSFIVAEGTIDEHVQDVLKNKEAMAQTMIDDGINAVGVMKAKEFIKRMVG
ncbi:DEAD/DEAH box helicase [Solibacillus silvestris]